MPFQSKSQRRKFHAMLDRGEISKSKVDEWERKTKGKLPERMKKSCLNAAVAMGQMRALDEIGMLKRAGVIESLLLRYAPYWAPAGLGAYFGGPEHRFEGALAGLGAGALGTRLMRSMAVRHTPELAKFKALIGKPEKLRRTLGKDPELAGQLGTLEKSEWLGRLGGGAGGGYLAHKMLGSQTPGYPAMREY